MERHVVGAGETLESMVLSTWRRSEITTRQAPQEYAFLLSRAGG